MFNNNYVCYITSVFVCIFAPWDKYWPCHPTCVSWELCPFKVVWWCDYIRHIDMPFFGTINLADLHCVSFHISSLLTNKLTYHLIILLRLNHNRGEHSSNKSTDTFPSTLPYSVLCKNQISHITPSYGPLELLVSPFIQSKAWGDP